MPDEPQHAVRDGDYRVIYVVGKKGLYKFFPDSAHIAMMKPVDVVGGEQGYMVGYGQLTTFPPAGGVRILIPTNASASPGGLWILEVAEPGSSLPTRWVLKNGAAGANALPAGWDWWQVAASPTNGNTITMFGCSPNTGDSGESSIHATAQWPDGFYQDTHNGLSPLWMTNDGGDNWFEVLLPVSYISTDNGVNPTDARIFPFTARLNYNDVNTPLLVVNVRGLTNFFGSLLDGLVHWYGNPADLNVIGNDFDGTTHRYWATDGIIFFGHIHTEPFGITYGPGGEAVISGSWGDAYGSHVGWSADIITPPYPDAVYLPGPALTSIDTIGKSTAIVGIFGGDIYYSADYHSIEPMLVVPKLSGEDFTWLAATLEGVVAVSNSGIYLISDIVSGSTPVLQLAKQTVNLYSARQLLRRIVVGRSAWTPFTGDDGIPANFAIYDGDSWTTIDGPADLQGLNGKLSSTALTVTEG